MEPEHQPATNMQSVGLKAFGRIADRWRLSPPEAARLADMPVTRWRRARGGALSDGLTDDQMLRLSALVGLYGSLEMYFGPSAAHWLKLINEKREFGDLSPLEHMIDGGLPAILHVRSHVDALLCGM